MNVAIPFLSLLVIVGAQLVWVEVLRRRIDTIEAKLAAHKTLLLSLTDLSNRHIEVTQGYAAELEKLNGQVNR
jgi:hypothetical protein